MKDPNQWDDLVRRKLAQRHHSPPPGAWQAVEQMLGAQQAAPPRRRRGWGWLLLALLALVGACWAWNPWAADWSGQQASSHASAQAAPMDASAFPVIEVEVCPSAPTDQAAQASASDPKQTASATNLPAEEIHRDPSLAFTSASSLTATQHDGLPPQEKSIGSSGQPLPEGGEVTDLAAVYALARQNITLSHRDLSSLAETMPGLIPATDERRYALQLEAGLAMSQSWQNTQLGNTDPVSSPLLGLGVSRGLRPGLRIQVGLRYQQRAGLNSDSTYRREQRDFGRNDTLTQIAPRRLHFLGLPLRLDLRLAGRHYLQVGAQANWLLETSSRVNTTVVDDDGSSQLPQARSGGFRQGFAPWDAQLLLGYRYYLGRGLRLGLSGSYGLRDLTEASFFNNDRINRAWNLRLMLEYDLTRF
jgi:hypothetical protein